MSHSWTQPWTYIGTVSRKTCNFMKKVYLPLLEIQNKILGIKKTDPYKEDKNNKTKDSVLNVSAPLTPKPIPPDRGVFSSTI